MKGADLIRSIYKKAVPLCLALMLTAMPCASAGAESADTVKSVSKDADAKATYTAHYPIGDKAYKFEYSDSFFSHSAKEYDHALAKASIAVAMAAMTSSETQGQYDKESTDPPRDKNLKSMLSSLGFDMNSYTSYRYDVPLSDSSDEAAFGIARKKTDSGDLIVVAVRGGGYGAEWASNFRVGKGRYASGFYKSGTFIKNAVADYCSKNHIGSDAKIWITGYSRGAAVTQTTAVQLNKAGFEPENIYAYAFAAPAVRRSVKDTDDNIHCIVNPADPVCSLPVPDWGFERAGVTHILDTSVITDKKTSGKFGGFYKKLTGRSYKYDRRGCDMTAAFSDVFSEASPTASAYVDSGTQAQFVSLMTEMNKTSEMSAESFDTKNLFKLSISSGGSVKLSEGSMDAFRPLMTADWTADMLMQHDPAVYLAYLYSADADRCYTSGRISKTVIIDGKADVVVYRNDKPVCSVTGGAVKGELIALAGAGSTRIYLSGDDYRISIPGKEDTLGYTVQTRCDGKSIKKAKMTLASANGRTYTGNITMAPDTVSAEYRLS
ncbi:MAG: hypothetical protein ILP19_06120 [Oscillospiraceae bacterium]|nr:hypothetical protein [Oscillospiraceae bacterium]